jgi:thioredoxin-like negative regulator of GroEL
MGKDLIVHVKSEDQLKELVTDNTTPVVLFFCGKNCVPCQTLCPIVEDRAINSFGKFIFAKLYVDEFQSQAYKYEYQGAIPYVALVKKGKVVSSFDGVDIERFEIMVSKC